MDTEKKTEENEEMHFTNEKKRGLAGQMRSQINKLTSDERWMLKAMLGYAFTDPPLGTEHQTLKSPSSAPIYIFESLWPPKLTDVLRKKEEMPFPLKNLIPTDVPALFEHSVDSLKKMFREIREMDELGQSGIVRGVSDFKKRFETDLSVKPSGFSRIWISGSVSFQKRRTKRTDGRTLLGKA